MILIHNKPKSNQKAELLFQQYLLARLPSYTHINETYLLSKQEFLNPFISVRKLEGLLHRFDNMHQKKKDIVLNILAKLPEKVKAAEKHNLISIDFVLIDDNQTKHYIEFHEKQHRNLSVNRSTFIYDEYQNKYDIPRFVQRFLKDVWRFENLINYKIIWYDWFERNPSHQIDDLLSSGNREFFIENSFSFSSLLTKN